MREDSNDGSNHFTNAIMKFLNERNTKNDRNNDRNNKSARVRKDAKENNPHHQMFKSIKIPKLSFDKYKENFMATAAGKIIAGAASGIGSMLLFAALFKIVSAKTAADADAIKEANRLDIERKSRLAAVRRQLAGPLRASAIELHERLEDILCTPMRRQSRLERLPQPDNFFALHFPDDPSDCVNSTLFRMCAYLEKVLQFNQGVHVEGVSEEDTWQYLLDKKIAAVQRALASSVHRFDSILRGERLIEVVAVAIARKMNENETKNIRQTFPEFEPANFKHERDFAGNEFEFRRDFRWPMRFFEDQQVAMGEIFASIRPKEDYHESLTNNNKSSVPRNIEYIAFVAKIEEALVLTENKQVSMKSNPWVHWMLPAREEVSRYASLQAQNFKLLRRREMRELTAARARLYQLKQALQDLIDMLYMRFDHPAFKVKSQDDKFKNVRKSEMKKNQQEKFKKQASVRAQKYWKIIEEYIPVIARNRTLKGIDRKGERQPWKLKIPFRVNKIEIPTRTGWEICIATLGVGMAILVPPLFLQFVTNGLTRSGRIPISAWSEKTKREIGTFVTKFEKTLQKTPNELFKDEIKRVKRDHAAAVNDSSSISTATTATPSAPAFTPPSEVSSAG